MPKHKVAALQPAAREQEPRCRWLIERTAIANRRSECLNSLRDEGIWLDSDGTINNAVLLVLGGNAQQGNWAYWHIDQGGSQSLPLNVNQSAFIPDLTSTITVLVNGNIYQAFKDPDGVYDSNSVLLTTLVDNTFSHGMVGLYQFSGGATSFSDLSVSGELAAVPTPIAGAGLPGLTLASGGLLCWWRRKDQQWKRERIRLRVT